MRVFHLFLILFSTLCFSKIASAQMPGAAATWCKIPKAPNIVVTTKTDKINWFFNYSKAQLNNFDVDTINPYGNHIHTDVGGLMKGGINMTQTMRFNSITHRGFNQSCFFYDTIRVELKIEPSIYIAREFPSGSCKHNAIKGHELIHINVDRQIVNKYAQIVGQRLKAEIDKRALYGPVSISAEGQVQEIMKARMAGILNQVNKEMEAERQKRQQAVDNIHEYERVNNLCR